MAKSIANGFPMGAVVTTAEIAKSLTGALHMNTYGGNPIGCAAAIAVLDVYLHLLIYSDNIAWLNPAALHVGN